MKNIFSNKLNLCLLSLSILLAAQIVHSQNRSSIWHFGNNVELDFCSGNPISGTGIGTGPITTAEGCASINDENCMWIFSTDGSDVIAPNPGPTTVNNDLLGNSSSTSSAIIVPHPCDSDLYYIFTVDFADGTNGIRFSVFDRVLNSVRPNEKNILLAEPSAERITAVKHANGKDFWVLAVMQNTNDFHRWLVTCNGVSNVNPIISTGPIITRSFGYLKASNCCDQLAMAFKSDLLLYNFDNSTGFINHTNTMSLSAINSMYGVEYTFDCSNLIATELGANGGPSANIYRISDPCSSPSLAQTWNVPNGNGRYTLGAVQIGPDDNLYIAKDQENSLAVIDPTGTTLNQNAISLQAGTQSTLGLPTFISGNIGDVCTDLLRLPTKPTELKFSPIENQGVEYVDVTNDGLYDIVSTIGNDIVYYHNTGTLGNPKFNFSVLNILYTVIPVGGHGLVCFTMYDYNGTGIPDLFILKETPIGNKQIDYVPGNIGPSYVGPSVVYPATVSNGLLNSSDQFMKVANLDADVEPEVLISRGSGNGSVVLYFDGNVGSPFSLSNMPGLTTTICLPGAPFFSSFPIPELHDADCDGDLDLFIGVSTAVLYYENIGSTTNYVVQDCNTLGGVCQTSTPCTFQASDIGITNIKGDTEYIFPRFVEVNNDGDSDLYSTRWVVASGAPDYSDTQYYESQECCSCPIELSFDYSPILSGTYEADQLIKATGTIPIGNNVIFIADSKQYNWPFTANGTLTDISPGCSACCGVIDPLADLSWMAPFIGDPNYSISQCTWNGECIFQISDFCLISDGLITYYDCDGTEICFSSGFASNCSSTFNPQNCVVLQGC